MRIVQYSLHVIEGTRMMTDKTEAKQIAEGLSPMEREWITGWQGVAGAAFNVVAGDLRRKGLLKSRSDWNLNPLGQAVRQHLLDGE